MGKGERWRRPGTVPVNPAPNQYATPPASVGPQTLGRFRTEPLVGFGTAERQHVRKVFISQAHQKTDMHGMASPGPAKYNCKSTMGPQDTAPSCPSYSFASSATANDKPGLGSPGPIYMMPASVGPQPDSRKPRAATPGFGASTRDKRAKICAPSDVCSLRPRARRRSQPRP